VIPLIGHLPHCEQLRAIWFRVADEAQTTRSPANEVSVEQTFTLWEQTALYPTTGSNSLVTIPYKPSHLLEHELFRADEVVSLGGRVTFSDYKVERIAFGLILGIALLMFFQPLVSLHGPNGSQASDVFNLRSGLSQLQSNLRVMAANKYSADSGASPVSSAAAPAAAKPMALPFSLREASLVPWFVFVALGFCLLALLDSLFLQKTFAIFSLAGGCAGAIAVLHVMLMGSDLQSWSEVLMNTALINSVKDPSEVIMIANSFLVSPGFGLYVLTTCLFLVPFLSYTRAVPRLKSIVRHERRVSMSQPICLRPVNSRYPEENCTSLDVSTGGLLLESPSSHYYAGMEVYLTRNVGAGDPANTEEHGSVVRVQKMPNGKCRMAIRIISEA
jgi:hypothetical protein